MVSIWLGAAWPKLEQGGAHRRHQDDITSEELRQIATGAAQRRAAADQGTTLSAAALSQPGECLCAYGPVMES